MARRRGMQRTPISSSLLMGVLTGSGAYFAQAEQTLRAHTQGKGGQEDGHGEADAPHKGGQEGGHGEGGFNRMVESMLETPE
eukprot:6462854-Amphidinium_carterae.1